MFQNDMQEYKNNKPVTNLIINSGMLICDTHYTVIVVHISVEILCFPAFAKLCRQALKERLVEVNYWPIARTSRYKT